MESLTKKVILAIGIFILIIVGLIVYSQWQKSQDNKAKNLVLSTANSFAKELFTFSYSNTASYEQRVDPYLSKDYKEGFLDNFGLPIQKNISAEEKNNYSKAASVKSEIITWSKNSATVNSTVKINSQDNLINNGQVLISTKKITITLVYQDKNWKVRKVVFSTAD